MGDLFSSSSLELALGLIFIFFLLSVVCSSINEFLAGLMKWRARELEQGIVNLLHDPDSAAKLLNHPLIVALGNRKSEATLVKLFAGDKPEKQGVVYLKNTSAGAPGMKAVALTASTNGKARATVTNDSPLDVERVEKVGFVKNYAGKPAYIPSNTFVVALLDVLLGDGAIDIPAIQAKITELAASEDQNTKALAKTLNVLLKDRSSAGKYVIGLQDVRDLVAALPADTPSARTERQKILDILDGAKSIDAFRDLVLALPLTDMTKAVVSYVNLGLGEVNAFKKRLEDWYDTSMETLRGVYKRRMQIYLFFIGLFVAVFFGADSINITNTLASNSTLRQALSTDATHATTPGDGLYMGPISTGSTMTDTGTITSTVQVSAANGVTTTTTTVTRPSLDKVTKEINSFSTLFGYDRFLSDWKGNGSDPVSLVIWKVLGLLITGFAVSFGAPFWFDLLNKVANLRAGIKPPADAPSV